MCGTIKAKWFAYGALAHQLAQLVFIFATGKSAGEFAVMVRVWLDA